MIGGLWPSDIETSAATLWRCHALQFGFDIESLVGRLELSVTWAPLQPIAGRRIAAVLSPERRTITLNDQLRGSLVRNDAGLRFTLAHEVGHWELHATNERAGAIRLHLAAEERTLCRQIDQRRAGAAVAAYEHQADLFATFLLAPRENFRVAVRKYGCEGLWQTRRLAHQLGLPAEATILRLEVEGLGYRDEHGVPRSGERPAPGQTLLDI